jgi:rhamnose utilization protein RhaD (predicted bifunctional aldolase and dehydrogenase)/NAD(P)-dependent dehydrogenase (short-subunit alcohol dehydrogenase family)
MKSRWSDADAQDVIRKYHNQGINEDIAIRTYTTRLLGGDPELVLHGGGNTSVKTTITDEDGSDAEVLCVKGSGWDMAVIEPAGLPAVRLEPLRRLAEYDTLTDEKMVALQRRLLIDPYAPNPSVEAILHALLPFRHVDHTHANAIVALTNQPDGEAICRELFPDFAIVPYVMPGFVLAKACQEVIRANPGARGMVLLKHGIFTYSDDPRESYEAMIAAIDKAERTLAGGKAQPFAQIALPEDLASAAEIAPIIRGALAHDSGVEGAPVRFVLDFRTSAAILHFSGGAEAADYAGRGNATPEHVIHNKRTSIVTPAPRRADLAGFAGAVRAAVAAFAADYRAYFARNNARVGDDRTMLDPLPRLFFVPGVGVFAAGKSAKAAAIGADVAEATVDVITAAEGIGTFAPLPEEDLFDIEYWSLEQAKLAKAVDLPMTRQIAVVTGAASGLGLGIATALRKEGAEVAMLDIAEEALASAARAIGGFPVVCDVTAPDSVRAAINAVAVRFGGVDVLMSNAGAAFQGALVEVGDDTFRKAFELNFWGHHHVARECVRVMRKQESGGAIVFNVSKQAVNPGPDFGPYGTSKAALMALMRQYAVEHGADGITVNAVNADRIRTGLLTDDFVKERARARGITPETYMRGNLLGREVTVADVAQAFVHLARARATTGAVLTVDGGNVAAMMR